MILAYSSTHVLSSFLLIWVGRIVTTMIKMLERCLRRSNGPCCQVFALTWQWYKDGPVDLCHMAGAESHVSCRVEDFGETSRCCGSLGHKLSNVLST